MSVFKNGRFYHFEFKLDGRRRRVPPGQPTSSKPSPRSRQRERLEKRYSQVIEEESREQQRKTIQVAADEFLKDYEAKHGRPYSSDEKARMLEAEQKLRTPQMHASLALDLSTGLRDKELRQIQVGEIDLIEKKALTVGKSKTVAGAGRLISLNETALAALVAHAAWYTRRFGACKPEWFVFAFGKPLPKTQPAQSRRSKRPTRKASGAIIATLL